MKLTDIAIQNAKPRQKPYKMGDAGGLYVEVTPAGSKVFRLKYRFADREKRLTIGAYPLVSLLEARGKAIEAKKQLQQGIDPSAEKQSEKASRRARQSNSFEAIAREWHNKNKPRWSEKHAERIWARLENNFIPWLGAKSIADINNSDVRSCLQRIEERGSHYMVQSCFQTISQVMGYAVASDLCVYQPPKALLKTFTAHVEKHMAAFVTPREFAGLLRAIEGFNGTQVVRSALLVAPYLFVRTQELRTMRWADLRLEDKEPVWVIPAKVMKMRQDHIVPLSKQAVKIIKELKPLTGHGDYVFQGGRDPKRPMSDAAINAALRRLGFDTQKEHTGHGFRAAARTLLHEQLGIEPAWIEAQLAHKPSDDLGDTYNRAQFLPQRQKMMRQWADYLDKLKVTL